MTPYQVIQYLKYRWNAKGRHGIHSPFVYSFIEDALRKKAGKQSVAELLTGYFHFSALIGERGKANYMDKGKDSNDPLRRFDTLYIKCVEAVDEKLILSMQVNDVLLITGIHNSKAGTHLWKIRSENPKVKLSIDLFEAGLLFFRDEFKVPQHFILK